MTESLEEIEFTIKKDGSVEYTIKGIKGSSCEDLAKVFEKIGHVKESVKTREYYEKEGDVKIVNKQRK